MPTENDIDCIDLHLRDDGSLPNTFRCHAAAGTPPSAAPGYSQRVRLGVTIKSQRNVNTAPFPSGERESVLARFQKILDGSRHCVVVPQQP